MSFILILFASILGSLHCAAMCGGFSAMCSQHGNAVKSQVFYNFGRLTAYLILGIIAIQLGEMVNNIGEQFGITRLASYITGALLIFAGAAALASYRLNFLKLIPYKLLVPIRNKLGFLKNYGYAYPLMLGFFSSFLPCGWLYSYLAVAANAGNLLNAILVMFFFWLGTLPILISIAGFSRIITSPLKKFAPTLISVMMIIAGIFSFTGHLNAAPSAKVEPSAHCAGHTK